MNDLEVGNFSGRTIMITGVAGQIGQALVVAIIEAGGRVLGLDVSAEKLSEIAEEKKWIKGQVHLVEADIRVREQVESAFDEGLSVFGNISGQINNAAVSVFDHWGERTDEDFDFVMAVNLKGTFHCIRTFLQHHLRKKTEGSIVNMASHYGLVSPDPRIYTDCARRNSEIYGASKAGVIQMTKYFAVNSGDAKVRVNAVAPGGVRNPHNPQGEDFQKKYGERCPMGRMAETEEIVGPVLFLLSSAASYINGHTLVVDGGSTSW